MSERNSYKMLNYDEYRNLRSLIKENPDMESVINNMSMFSPAELSIDSHDIKNHIAYLKTSFQLLKKKSPELSENKYITRMEDVISQLIYHMERTTLYRYSMKKADKESVNINDIMYELPDAIDDIIDNTCTYSFCLDNIPNILINAEQLKTMLTEAVQNACEASDCTGEITLVTSQEHNNVIIEIINNGCLPSHADSQNDNSQNDDSTQSLLNYIKLSQPFYSTKPGHIGVGLSIIHQICLTNNGYADIHESDGKTILYIQFPVISEK